MRPEKLWFLSSRLHRRGLTPLAAVLKSFNFVVFGATLPYEVDVPADVVLWHRGHGTVIHPATKIGRRVRIAHNVTVSAGDWHVDTDLGVTIEDGATLTVGCAVVPREGSSLTVGAGAIVGANAVVTEDVPAGVTAVGAKARTLGAP